MRWRAILAALSLAALGAAAATSGAAVWGAATIVLGALFLRPSVGAQIAARAMAWAWVLPSAATSALVVAMTGHAPHLRSIAVLAAATLALVVSRPLLSTERARAEFAPLALRSWFLAAATFAMAIGLDFASLAGAFAHFSLWRDVIGLGALAASLVAAGVGLSRMRTWGLALGALAAAMAAPIAMWMHDSLSIVALVLGAAPGLLMGATLLAARARAPETASARVRVEPRLRVAPELAPDVELAESADDLLLETGSRASRPSDREARGKTLTP